MLRSYTYNNKEFQFVEEVIDNPNENIFTIIVGKNGTGKSRLLSRIVSEFLGPLNPRRLYSNRDLGFELQTGGKVNFAYSPSKIISASTSPFDRFPINKRLEPIKGYSYLGLRDLMSKNFGIAYLSKIIGSLIEVANHNPKQMKEISNVLNYLGYNDTIIVKFQARLLSKHFKLLTGENDPVNTFIDLFLKNNQPNLFLNKAFFYQEDVLIEAQILKFIEILKKSYPFLSNNNFEIELNNNGIYINNLFQDSLQDLVFLMQSGIIRLKDVGLEKIKTRKRYSISDASSGEQSVVIGMLGIASQIQDNCLICIDEPEICLHPEWQEKYIKLLFSTFQNFKNCHFIIATHSPQIISKLESTNCYVLTMETGKVKNAKYLNNNSADFQLATVFNSPGFKNEYLSRLAFSIMSKVAKTNKFDKDDLEGYELLNHQIKFMEKDDPLVHIISLLKNLRTNKTNKKNA